MIRAIFFGTLFASVFGLLLLIAVRTYEQQFNINVVKDNNRMEAFYNASMDSYNRTEAIANNIRSDIQKQKSSGVYQEQLDMAARLGAVGVAGLQLILDSFLLPFKIIVASFNLLGIDITGTVGSIGLGFVVTFMLINIVFVLFEFVIKWPLS